MVKNYIQLKSYAEFHVYTISRLCKRMFMQAVYKVFEYGNYHNSEQACSINIVFSDFQFNIREQPLLVHQC